MLLKHTLTLVEATFEVALDVQLLDIVCKHGPLTRIAIVPSARAFEAIISFKIIEETHDPTMSRRRRYRGQRRDLNGTKCWFTPFVCHKQDPRKSDLGNNDRSIGTVDFQCKKSLAVGSE